jgi:hypothetical protein
VIPAAPAITLKLILAAGVLSIGITCTGGAEDWNLALFISRPFGTAQAFIGTKTRYIDNSTDATSTVPITAAYTAKFGSLPALTDRVAIDYIRFMESGGEVRARIQEVVTVTAS